VARAAALQLRELFQLIRVSPREYRLVSLFDSLTVTSHQETAGVLDRVLPALEQGVDRRALVRGASRREAQAIRGMIRDLDERGLLEPARAGEDPESGDRSRYARQRRFFSNFQAVSDMSQNTTADADDAGVLQARLKSATVMVVGLGRVGSRVAQALAAAGVGTLIGADLGGVRPGDRIDSLIHSAEAGRAREDVLVELMRASAPGNRYTPHGKAVFGPHGATLPDGLDFIVLCEDTFDPDHHAAINQAALHENIPWIGYRIFRTRLEIGPTVIPHETACYRCYELRRVSNSPGFYDELELQRRLVENGGDLGTLNITLGADLLALEVVKSLTHFTSAATYGHVYVLDIVSLESHTRPLLRIPRCPDCGAAATKPARNVWRYDSEAGLAPV
jgi:bacteriocin biosynthesis cyclodehydratase domain-containing protein